jgi:hypothetical protein
LALVVVIVAIAIAPTIAIADAPRADQIEKARSSVLSDDYQAELPGSELGSPDGTGAGSARQHFQRGDEDYEKYVREHQDTREQHEDSGSSLFTMVMWIVIIAGLALLVFWIASEVIKYGGDEAVLAAEPKPVDEETERAVLERPLGDAEELAHRGEYREAIHALLLRTLQELVRSSAVRVGPAMTSREILARVPLLADARDALHALIIQVEITHFGGDEATVDDYVQCRNQFQKFATAFRAANQRAAGGSASSDQPGMLGSNA